MFDYGYQFERFWKEVPLKVGKGAAYRAWNNIVKHWDGGEASFADMLVQHLIERKRTDAKWIEGRYIPQPATFLNGHRWEDDYVRVRKASQAHARFEPEVPRYIPTDDEIARRYEQLEQLRKTLH